MATLQEDFDRAKARAAQEGNVRQDVTVAEAALVAAKKRLAVEQRQKQKAEYQELACQHRAAGANVDSLREQFHRAEGVVSKCQIACEEAERALAEHAAAVNEFPTEAEAAAASAERAKLEATLAKKRDARREAIERREAVRMEAVREHDRLQRLEAGLRNSRKLLAGEVPGWEGGLFVPGSEQRL